MHIPRKRIHLTSNSQNSFSDSDGIDKEPRCARPSKFIKTVEDVDDIVEKKLQKFKEALLADFRGMISKGKTFDIGQSSKKNPSDGNNRGRNERPPCVLKIFGEGLHAPGDPPRSPTLSKGSCSKGSCSPHTEPTYSTSHYVTVEDTTVLPSTTCKNTSTPENSDAGKVNNYLTFK